MNARIEVENAIRQYHRENLVDEIKVWIVAICTAILGWGIGYWMGRT